MLVRQIPPGLFFVCIPAQIAISLIRTEFFLILLSSLSVTRLEKLTYSKTARS